VAKLDTIEQKDELRNDISPQVKRVTDVRNKAGGQKNRAKVLVFASAIESDLGELFAKYFVGSAGIKDDRLIDPKKSSSMDLSVKIELAYRLGLISHRLRNHLNMIREFRNDCAHLENDFDFDEGNNKSRINSAFLELGSKTQETFNPKSSNSYEEKFETFSSLCILMIQNQIDNIQKTREQSQEVIYTT
jgi:hypothetical protein